MQPIIMIMIYYCEKKLYVSYYKFLFDLDSVWVRLKIFL